MSPISSRRPARQHSKQRSNRRARRPSRLTQSQSARSPRRARPLPPRGVGASRTASMSVIVAPDELRRLSERQRVSGYGRGAPLPYGAGCGNDVARGVDGEPGSRARPMRAVQVGEGGRGSRGELRVAPLSAHVNETPPWCGCRILLGPASSPHNDAVLVWRVAIAAVAVQHHIARVMPVALRHDLIEAASCPQHARCVARCTGRVRPRGCLRSTGHRP